MISRVRMRRLSGVSQQRRQQLAAAKTGGDPNPPLRRARGEGMAEEGTVAGGRRGVAAQGEEEAN